MIDSRYVTVTPAGTIVVFDEEVGDIELVSDGTDDLYVAVNPEDGFVMAPAADGTYWLPSGGLSRILPTHRSDRIVLHLMTATASVGVGIIPTHRTHPEA